MKKMITYIAIALGIIILLFFIANRKTNKYTNHPKQDFVNNKGYLLKNINFSDGNYALYIRHKKYGEFMVLDPQALKNNKNKLKVKLSFINYLPGEGDRRFGVMLFKNNELLTAKTGGVFNAFEIGDLMNYAIPVKMKSFQGVKRTVQQKLDTITNDTKAFLMSGATFVPDNREFCFRVYFPSIAVPVTRKKDENGVKQIATVKGIDFNTWTMKEEIKFEKKWGEKLKNCIRQKAPEITDYHIGISSGSLSDDNLFSDGIDLTSKDGHLLYINDYMFYDFTAYICAGKNEAKKLFNLDYTDCLSEEDRRRPQLIDKIKTLVAQSNHPNLKVDKGEVGLYQYKDKLTKYVEIYQQEYEIRWLQVTKK